MSSHSNQAQAPDVNAMQPPSIKRIRQAIRKARENEPLRVMPNNLARELFPPEVNRRLDFRFQ
jgi:hypothetical protein